MTIRIASKFVIEREGKLTDSKTTLIAFLSRPDIKGFPLLAPLGEEVCATLFNLVRNYNQVECITGIDDYDHVLIYHRGEALHKLYNPTRRAVIEAYRLSQGMI